jgi:hypothetical protein
MNTRPLSPFESRNLAELNSTGRTSVLLFVTETGLRKSIFDATEPMRRMLRDNHIHDYSLQPQGQDFKVYKPAVILGDSANEETSVSMYRPPTKKGDPRLWFSRFNRFAEPDDVCAVFIEDGRLHVLNLTRSAVSEDLSRGVSTPCGELLQSLATESNKTAEELLARLREIANKGPIKAVCEGATAIGRSIETALGIDINSSRSRDYMGEIEIKSGRAQLVGRETRATLFACVADWHLSNLKSSQEILKKYGYQRGEQFKLYCTVSTTRPNSQGLQLSVDRAMDWLKEIHQGSKIEDVCVWELNKLHSRLSEKHKETFWIKAKSLVRGNNEFFHLESVTHTSKPSIEQFDRLLEDGTITLDHLIKNKKSDKGPLFKIERPRIPELFLGQFRSYSLAA